MVSDAGEEGHVDERVPVFGIEGERGDKRLEECEEMGRVEEGVDGEVSELEGKRTRGRSSRSAAVEGQRSYLWNSESESEASSGS
mgnify:FL=1